MNRNFKKFNVIKQAGFTLVEIGFVLVVAAILAIPLYSRFTTNKSKAAMSEDAENLMALAAAGAEKWTNLPDYSGATEATLLNVNVFPADMVIGAVIKNKARGTVTCSAVDLTGDKDGMECASTNYPKADCVTVVQKIDKAMRRITVGATVVKDTDGTVDLTKLGAACVGTGTNVIKFAFGK